MSRDFGPGMPSATPASDARAAHAVQRREALRALWRVQRRALRDGALEACRTAGVVLVVLFVLGDRRASLWLALALIYVPQLYALLGILVQLGVHAWLRWKVCRPG